MGLAPRHRRLLLRPTLLTVGPIGPCFLILLLGSVEVFLVVEVAQVSEEALGVLVDLVWVTILMGREGELWDVLGNLSR